MPYISVAINSQATALREVTQAIRPLVFQVGFSVSVGLKSVQKGMTLYLKYTYVKIIFEKP